MQKTRSFLGLLILMLTFSGCQLLPKNLKATGTPTPPVIVTKGAELKIPGKIAFARSGNLWLMEQGVTRQLTSGGKDSQPAWSPDGTVIAYVKREQSYSEINLIVVGTGDFKALTNNKASRSVWVFRPTWTPDAKQIAYISDANSWDTGVYLMNADGRGARRLTQGEGDGGADSPTWAPDGKSLALAAFRGGSQQVWNFNLTNSRWTQLTQTFERAYDPKWSPAEDKIAFAGVQDKKTDIYIMNLDGTGQRRLTNDGSARAPSWSPDGQFLAWIAEKNGSFDIYAAAVERGAEGELTLGQSARLTSNFDVDATGGLSWLY